MKKLFLIMLLLALTLGPVSALAQEEPIVITDRAGLEAIAQNPGGSYSLQADIDMGQADWVPLDFFGTFEGNGHVLYNLKVHAPGTGRATTVDGNNKKYDSALAGFFGKVEDATIRNLTLLNARVSVDSSEDCFAACLAAYINRSTIDQCTVTGRVDLHTTATMVGVGGLVGFGGGTISNSKADVTLVFVDSNTSVDCEEFLGGALACGYADVLNCQVKVEGFASVHGYVHNGGLVGMYHLHGEDYPETCYVKDNQVEAAIHFFEDVGSRRAYCKAEIGEVLNRHMGSGENEVLGFIKDESKDYHAVLDPETCENPSVTATVTAPTCTEFGYTTYACTGCGYCYTDDYTAPSHVAGTWNIAEAADEAHEGKEVLTCAACGTVLEERTIPIVTTTTTTTTLAYVEECQIPADLQLHYRETAVLTATLLPLEMADQPVIWNSSNPAVATVDENGTVCAVGSGTAVITCMPQEGGASAQCTVEVSFTPLQWVIYYLLFGWCWY